MPRPPDDYSDVLIDLILGYECNVQCDYCSVTDAMRCENLTTAAALRELQAARGLGMHHVAFGGGEPTMRKDLLPLARWCRDRGFDSIKVSSNGLMYSYPEFARRAVDAGVTLFHVSAMAHTPELYEKILGLKGALELVVKGVRNLVALGHVPVLDLIVKNDTYPHLAEIIEFWSREGVKTFALWLVSLSDRNRQNLGSLPRVTEMRPELFRAFDRAAALGVEAYSRHIPLCMLPGHESNVYDLREDRVLVVTPNSRFFLWESAISPSEYSPRCEACRHVRDACRGIRSDYLERFGDEEVVPCVR